MLLDNLPQVYLAPMATRQPEMFYGTSLPDGDGAVGAVNFKLAAIGSTYERYVTANHTQLWKKVKNDARDDDWFNVRGVICQRLVYADFTDSTGTTGTKSLNATLPVGAYYDKAYVDAVTGFTGDTTATIQISGGISVTADVDGYTTGTPSVFTTASTVTVGVPSGVRTVETAGIPLVTITKGSDWGTGTTGALTVTLVYSGGR
jgi:hypothetical protein